MIADRLESLLADDAVIPQTGYTAGEVAREIRKQRASDDLVAVLDESEYGSSNDHAHCTKW